MFRQIAKSGGTILIVSGLAGGGCRVTGSVQGHWSVRCYMRKFSLLRRAASHFRRDCGEQVGPRNPLCCRPRLETLENRDVPSTLVQLDFNGMSRWDVDLIVNRHISSTVTTGPQPSWINISILNTQFGGFEAYKFLDFDGNGRLDSADGNRAAGIITDRVQQLFAPYDVTVFRQDSTVYAVSRMMSASTHDALIV